MTDYSYSVRTSAFGSDRHFLLTPDRLTWTGHRAGSVAYRDIIKVKVYQARFWDSSRLYWTCILHARGRNKIYLSAAHRLHNNAVEDRTETYVPFIKELETRIAGSNKDAAFIIGRSWISRFEVVVGWVAVQTQRAIRHFDCDRTANIFANLMRAIGPRLRGHRIARAQLKSAFPEKSEEELEKLLGGMWDNIGRVAAEYSHLGALWDFDPKRPELAKRILPAQGSAERCLRLGQDHAPALMFAAHLANWEIPPLAATAHGRQIVLLFRRPKIAPIASELIKLQGSGVAGLIPAGLDAPFKIREALRRNCLVGMLIDQHDSKGIEVNFFGRSCRVSGTLARMARLFECPIYGSRVVRLPSGQYRFEMTEPLTPPRDQAGKIDVAGTMQMVTSIIEGWVREHPEQWMWTHRRWR